MSYHNEREKEGGGGGVRERREDRDTDRNGEEQVTRVKERPKF